MGLPGKVVFKVQRGSANDTYTMGENDLHTVLRISLEQALFGFDAKFTHLDGDTVSIRRHKVSKPGEIVKLPMKGLTQGSSTRGDLFVRLHVDMPTTVEGRSVTLMAPEKGSAIVNPQLEPEIAVELRDGVVWRRWGERENPLNYKLKS